jgi:hypothetical protein
LDRGPTSGGGSVPSVADAAVDDSRQHLNDEIGLLLNLLETGNAQQLTKA